MRTVRHSSSAYDGLFSALRAFLDRRAQELTGLCLIALAGAVAVALVTWSVDDPSLNNATDTPIHNLLGWPGAIVADLLMQLLGLGAIAALMPLALWGRDELLPFGGNREDRFDVGERAALDHQEEERWEHHDEEHS